MTGVHHPPLRGAKCSTNPKGSSCKVSRYCLSVFPPGPHPPPPHSAPKGDISSPPLLAKKIKIYYISCCHFSWNKPFWALKIKKSGVFLLGENPTHVGPPPSQTFLAETLPFVAFQRSTIVHHPCWGKACVFHNNTIQKSLQSSYFLPNGVCYL